MSRGSRIRSSRLEGKMVQAEQDLVVRVEVLILLNFSSSMNNALLAICGNDNLRVSEVRQASILVGMPLGEDIFVDNFF